MEENKLDKFLDGEGYCKCCGERLKNCRNVEVQATLLDARIKWMSNPLNDYPYDTENGYYGHGYNYEW